jgi:hypothetical protein
VRCAAASARAAASVRCGAATATTLQVGRTVYPHARGPSGPRACWGRLGERVPLCHAGGSRGYKGTQSTRGAPLHKRPRGSSELPEPPTSFSLLHVLPPRPRARGGRCAALRRRSAREPASNPFDEQTACPSRRDLFVHNFLCLRASLFLFKRRVV